MSLNQQIGISIDPSVEIGALAAVEALKKGGWRSQLMVPGSVSPHDFDTMILRDSSIQAVIEFSLGALATARLGLHPGEVSERLVSAALLGLPQVIIPGGVDHVVIHQPHESSSFRKSNKIDDISSVIRTSPEDNDVMGKEIAFKASASKGPVVIVFPRGGLSHWDGEGKPLHDPEANQTLLDSLHLWKAPDVELIESHRHINDPLFAQIAVDQLLRLLVVRR